MNPRERFLCVMDFKRPDDRLPLLEWAPWWDKTYRRWQNEGLIEPIENLNSYFDLESLETIRGGGVSAKCPAPLYHGAPIISDEESYETIRPYVLNETLISSVIRQTESLKEKHDRGDISIRLRLDGFFWFPRSLFGIENHLLAFYDYPELMHRINAELSAFNLQVLEKVLCVLKPDMVGFAEDMSYNHGPMLSKELFMEFLAPYYKQVIPYVKSQGIKVMVDTDGDVTHIIPWLLDVGVDGIFPLERQAGVDVAEIREKYPHLLMLGAYDKMVMSKGEAFMRAEFERLLPVMKKGGFIPSVDHQTPPEVSLENYRIYRRLLEEYCIKAMSYD